MKNHIPIPEGMDLPQGATEGEEFDITVRCEVEGGMLSLKSINGIPLPKESEKDEAAEKMMAMTPSEAGMEAGY